MADLAEHLSDFYSVCETCGRSGTIAYSSSTQATRSARCVWRQGSGSRNEKAPVFWTGGRAVNVHLDPDGWAG